MMTAPIPSMIQDPAEVEFLRQRRQARRRRLLAVAATATLVLGVLAWKVGRHLTASFWLETNHYAVAWGMEGDDWKQGGATSVRYTWRQGFFSSEPPAFDLQHLKKLHRLVELDLSTLYGVGDGHLARIDELTELERLNLERGHQPEWAQNFLEGLTDATLVRIGRLEHLTELNLGAQRISDAGLGLLGNLRKLETLDLVGTEITDLGLEPLLRLPNLKILDLTNTKVTNQGVDAFQAKRPGVRIVAEHLPIIPWTPTQSDPPKAPR